MKKKYARKSSSGEIFKCKLLEPRLSAGRTSILQKPSQSLEQISYNMAKLTTAHNILSPLIDEIISNATSYSAKEIKNILEKNSPICSITQVQFNRARKASEIMEQVKNSLEITEILPYWANTPFLYYSTTQNSTDEKEQKILIDKELMKVLMNLHEMIAEAIRLIKKAYPVSAIEENSYIKDNEKQSIDQLDENIDRSNLYADLSKNFVIIDSNSRNNSNEHHGKTNVYVSEAKPSTETLIDPHSENSLQHTSSFNNREATEDKYVSAIEPKKSVMDRGSQVTLRNTVKINNQETCCNLNSTETEQFEKCNIEMQKLKKMYKDLARTVANLNPTLEKDKADTAVMEYKQLSSKSQYEILECLKELDQIKDLLKKVGNPNLSIDPDGMALKKNCCSYMQYPHVHAKLNSVPVILKLKQSTVDILLAEQDNYDHKSSRGNNGLQGYKQHVYQLNLNKLKPGLDLPINDFRLEIDDSRFTFDLFDKNKNILCSNLLHKSTTDLELDDRSQLSKESLMLLNKLLVLREDSIDETVLPEYFYVYDRDDESNTALPYSVNKKSLPNMNICPPMDISVTFLAKRCTTEVSHNHNVINAQLKALGVENLVRASLPAKCCRKAVINEDQDDYEPFRASIKSLPLTTSDMLIISEVSGGDDEVLTVSRSRYSKNKYEYYTNLASVPLSIPPKNTIYEVRFFEIFKRKSEEPSGMQNDQTKVSQILKRLIYLDNNITEDKGKKCDKKNNANLVITKKKHNKKCQTQCYIEKNIILKDKSQSHNWENFNQRCDKGDKKHPCKKCVDKDMSFVKSKRSNDKVEKGRREKSKFLPPVAATQTCQPRPKSAYTCNAGCILSTIYEAEERRKIKQRKEKRKSSPEILYKPVFDNICSCMQNDCKEIKQKENWIYCCSHGTSMKKTSNISIISTKPSLGKTTENKKRTKYRSHIPRLVKGYCTSDTSSIHSITRGADTKTQTLARDIKLEKSNSNSEIKIFQKTLKPSTNFNEIINDSKRITSYELDLKKLKCNYKSSSESKTRLFRTLLESNANLETIEHFLDYEHNVKSDTQNISHPIDNDNRKNSLDVLEEIESFKNINESGPGYVAVLRPSCGCPHVSIFIPCYCNNISSQKINCCNEDFNKIIYSESCKKIILPKSCRVNSEKDYPATDDEEQDISEWIQSLTESFY